MLISLSRGVEICTREKKSEIVRNAKSEFMQARGDTADSESSPRILFKLHI